MESHTLLSHLAEAWAYVTLGASGIITEEAAPIVGGFAAHEGHLGSCASCSPARSAPGVPASVLYALGRWRSKWVRKRFRTVGRYVTRLLVFVRRSPWRSTFAVRFAFGSPNSAADRLRCSTPTHPRLSHRNRIASIIWSTLFALVGWLFGETALLVLGHIRRYDDYFAAFLVAAVVVVTVLLIQRRKPNPMVGPTGTTGDGPAVREE